MSEPEQPLEENEVDEVEAIVVRVATQTRDEPNLFDKKMAELSGQLPAEAFKAYTLTYQANKTGSDIVEQFKHTYQGDAGNAYAMRQVTKALLLDEITLTETKVAKLREYLAIVLAADPLPE